MEGSERREGFDYATVCALRKKEARGGRAKKRGYREVVCDEVVDG